MSGASDMLDAALDIERPEPLTAGSTRPDGICVATLPSGCALSSHDTGDIR